MKRMKLAFCCALLLFGSPSAGSRAATFDKTLVPHVNDEARDNLAGRYATANKDKAFLIGPAGSWAWKADAKSAEEAVEKANERCRRNIAPLNCVPYAIGDEVVFDRGAWASILAPYPSGADKIGPERGQRLQDIAFKTPDGKPGKLSDYRGKIVVFHVWGSWCPPCRFEMPAMNRLYDSMKGNPDVAFVPISVKEGFSTSKSWTDSFGFSLPFVDANAYGDNFTLSNGDSLNFRNIAPLIPTTFVLGRDGTVIFRKVGPFLKWEEFKPQLDHAIANAK